MLGLLTEKQQLEISVISQTKQLAKYKEEILEYKEAIDLAETELSSVRAEVSCDVERLKLLLLASIPDELSQISCG
jgi:hypothetical protein